MPYTKLDYVEDSHEGIEILDHLCSWELCGRGTPPRVGHTRLHLVCGVSRPSSDTGSAGFAKERRGPHTTLVR